MNIDILRSALPNLDDERASKLHLYYEMLIDYNEKVNLTRITEPNEVATKHFADSVLPAELIPQGARCIDVGTGAGFPGIPLKIMRPDIELTLLDSLSKRVKFLEEVCSTLGISAECIHARAEDAANMPEYRGSFDIALTRAVASASVLTELTVPFLKIGGSSLMYKGANAKEELTEASNALKILSCESTLIPYDADWGMRFVIRAVKCGATPKKYPRRAGVVSKSPL